MPRWLELSRNMLVCSRAARKSRQMMVRARELTRDISVSRTSGHKGVILGRNSVFGVFRL